MGNPRQLVQTISVVGRRGRVESSKTLAHHGDEEEAETTKKEPFSFETGFGCLREHVAVTWASTKFTK